MEKSDAEWRRELTAERADGSECDVVGTLWGRKRYMDMDRLKPLDRDQDAARCAEQTA